MERLEEEKHLNTVKWYNKHKYTHKYKKETTQATDTPSRGQQQRKKKREKRNSAEERMWPIEELRRMQREAEKPWHGPTATKQS